jgi:copper(I)-binding protein
VIATQRPALADPVLPKGRLPMRGLLLRGLLTAGLLTGTAALTGCSPTPDAKPVLKVSGAYLPQPPMADMAAGYFTITNTGKAADELTGVTSEFTSDVSVQTTTPAGQMQDAASLPIPAGGKLVLSTGGNHLMLMGLKEKPTVGEKVSFALHFAKSSPITVQVPVESATYQPPKD